MTSDRVSIVTGAAGGIGAAIGTRFLSDGFRVVGLDKTYDEQRHSAQGIAEIPCDLEKCCTDPLALSAVIAAIRSEIGDGSLHVIVNNAAVQRRGTTEQATIGDIESTFRTNVFAPFLIVQALLADLERNRGCVINIGSVHSRLTKQGFVAYAASKAALAGLTRAMAIDLRGRIRINAVHPAAVATAMLEAGFANRPAAMSTLGEAHPIGRIADPAEVAAVVAFLASDEASYVTGANWEVDGGIGGRLHDPE